MGIVADRLKALTVRVTSPDGNIQGLLNGRDMRIRFRPGTYHQYGEELLEHQLSRLFTLTATGYRRGHGHIMSEVDLISITDPADANSDAQRRYLEAVPELVVTGATTDGLVRIRCVGMRDWRCRIRPGTIAALEESQFVTETETAIQSLLTHYRREIMFLKDRCYNLQIPMVREARLAAEQSR
ncbi:MAG TPA: hypothetical protein H9881_11960 [Candidatus Stackebrandtia excrementipullorum]|nr:hypothetical protein [Candidatus Stackebrandtia excrementipullorum]